MVDFEKAMAALKPQKDEFNSLNKLIKAYNALPAIVDDDYPEMRHRYESCMKDFIDAIRKNGRLNA